MLVTYQSFLTKCNGVCHMSELLCLYQLFSGFQSCLEEPTVHGTQPQPGCFIPDFLWLWKVSVCSFSKFLFFFIYLCWVRTCNGFSRQYVFHPGESFPTSTFLGSWKQGSTLASLRSCFQATESMGKGLLSWQSTCLACMEQALGSFPSTTYAGCVNTCL